MRQNIQVPYGYEPPAPSRKGTLIFYDSFEHISDEGLTRAAEEAENRKFKKLVLYPLHEETVRRMAKEPVGPFYRREDRLHEWRRDQEGTRLPIAVEGWEGKRKKYTPIDAALRHLTEVYPAPHFLYLTPEMANQFASFSSFEEWIVKIRLLLAAEPGHPHPRLAKFSHRWDLAGGHLDSLDRE
ncbi:hypothetical protein IM700_010390 [Paenibacillus sp. DXFW5]|uniref:Uncharacterized protein n=1 Tax=Paenibacillus rhizolycopersici TaxID=2780073 RepID=A0ABS2H982_9BACL|nr:hypothetical protein [Paenibacillus rhizolycopersici]MBM6996053.1 hypothetical protein [Paenibacillus rhizolycopersici]